MRTSTLSWLLLSATLAAPMAVHAQANKQVQADAPAPPQTMRLEEGEDPAVKITPPDRTKSITEKRQGGQVTEVKVNTGATTYYAKPNDTPGAMRGDGQSDTSRPVQFQVGEFGQPPEAKPGAEPVRTLPPKK